METRQGLQWTQGHCRFVGREFQIRPEEKSAWAWFLNSQWPTGERLLNYCAALASLQTEPLRPFLDIKLCCDTGEKQMVFNKCWIVRTAHLQNSLTKNKNWDIYIRKIPSPLVTERHHYIPIIFCQMEMRKIISCMPTSTSYIITQVNQRCVLKVQHNVHHKLVMKHLAKSFRKSSQHYLKEQFEEIQRTQCAKLSDFMIWNQRSLYSRSLSTGQK